jgi:pimeloyl-ACP methyl ester carboxylesterase
LNVVFLHGLGGDGSGTWKHRNGSYWPDLVADVSPCLRVWVADLPTAAAGASLTINEVSDAFLEVLSQEQPQFASDKIYFVCHSLGGLVCKQLLRNARERGAWPSDDVAGVFFAGTPHTGSRWANRLRLVLGPASTNAVHDLKKNGERLRNLATWFTGFAHEKRLQVQSVLEARRTPLVPLPVLRWIVAIWVVDKESGDDRVSMPLFALQDHLELAKPPDASAEQHRMLRLRLGRTLEAMSTPSAASNLLRGDISVGSAATTDKQAVPSLEAYSIHPERVREGVPPPTGLPPVARVASALTLFALSIGFAVMFGHGLGVGNTATPQCQFDGDCAPGLRCYAGQCFLAATREDFDAAVAAYGCAADTDCAQGDVCDGGVCVGRSPAPEHADAGPDAGTPRCAPVLQSPQAWEGADGRHISLEIARANPRCHGRRVSFTLRGLSVAQTGCDDYLETVTISVTDGAERHQPPNGHLCDLGTCTTRSPGDMAFDFVRTGAPLILHIDAVNTCRSGVGHLQAGGLTIE